MVVLVEPSCQGIAAFGLGRRGSLSMAVSGAFPDKFKEVHPEYGTPAFGTWVIGAAAIIWYVVGSWISQNFLFDSLSALSIVVAFDYGLTGPAGRRSRSSRPTVPSPPRRRIAEEFERRGWRSPVSFAVTAEAAAHRDR